MYWKVRSLRPDFLTVIRKVLTVTLKGTGAASVYFDLGETEDDLTGNATVHNKRDDPYTTDFNQDSEMVYISQPRNVVGGPLLRTLGGQYVYPKSAGRGALLYMIDSVRSFRSLFCVLSNKKPRVPMRLIQ